jgi:hypothetical protein
MKTLLEQLLEDEIKAGGPDPSEGETVPRAFRGSSRLSEGGPASRPSGLSEGAALFAAGASPRPHVKGGCTMNMEEEHKNLAVVIAVVQCDQLGDYRWATFEREYARALQEVQEGRWTVTINGDPNKSLDTLTVQDTLSMRYTGRKKTNK